MGDKVGRKRSARPIGIGYKQKKDRISNSSFHARLSRHLLNMSCKGCESWQSRKLIYKLTLRLVVILYIPTINPLNSGVVEVFVMFLVIFLCYYMSAITRNKLSSPFYK